MANRRKDLNKAPQWKKTHDETGGRYLLKLFSESDNTNRLNTSSINVDRNTLVGYVEIFKKHDYVPNESEERKQVSRCVDQVFGLHTHKISSVDIMQFRSNKVITKYQAFFRLDDLSEQSLSKADALFDLINTSVRFEMNPQEYIDLQNRNHRIISPNAYKFCKCCVPKYNPIKGQAPYD